jgi:hypothetical protein
VCQSAVYRLGHSLVRPSYRAHPTGDAGRLFFGMIFDLLWRGWSHETPQAD